MFDSIRGLFVWLSRIGQVLYDIGNFCSRIVVLIASFGLKHAWFFLGIITAGISTSMYFILKIVKGLFSVKSAYEAAIQQTKDGMASGSASGPDATFLEFMNFAVPLDQMVVVIVLLLGLWNAVYLYRLAKSFLPTASS